jgi:putative transposase
MNLTLLIKLQPSADQVIALRETMFRFNAACNAISEVAFREHSANKFLLQRLTYRDMRERFGLSAQHTVRAIGKVSDAYKRDKAIRPTFDPLGAIVYDQRIMAWKGIDRVSLTTLEGRVIVPIVMNDYHAPRLDRKRGQADLILRDRTFYLAVVVDIDEPPTPTPTDWLGVDLGIKNIAADSDGTTYSGAMVNGLRYRHARLRARLQAKGTQAARRLLQKRRCSEGRFGRDVNHSISKNLVAKAKDTGRGIALENLHGIRDRITVRQAQRRQQHSWSFFQLRTFLGYKAALAGVAVSFVDPRNTSRTCPRCGHVDKANRPSRDHFQCVCCGNAGPADTIAASNIRCRAFVMTPNLPDGAPAPVSGTSPCALARGS